MCVQFAIFNWKLKKENLNPRWVISVFFFFLNWFPLATKPAYG